MNEVIREILDRSKTFDEADFIPTVFGKFQKEAVGGALPVVLFGAGSAGKELLPILKLHGVHPVCFCDNNPSRAGELHCGLPVVSLLDLRREHKDSLIVVTAGACRNEIKEQLTNNGFKREKVLSVSNNEAMIFYTHLAQWYWPEEDLLSNEKELLEAYNSLSDQKSRDIFISRIALFTAGADYQSFRNFILKYSDVQHNQDTDFQEFATSTNFDCEAFLQFNNDVLKLCDNEVLIDGGAYAGDSALEFIDTCARKHLTYRKIICFEPDSKTYAKLQKNTAYCRDVWLRPFGLWSHSSTIKFAGSDVMKPGSTKIISQGDNNVNPASTTTEIPTTSIDEEFPDETITLIKMDIEGAEMEALRGAMKTIKRLRPKLIVSAYHKRNDLFEIPLLIHEMDQNYKLYYRHFSANFGETTLFAIP
jgi:FkbM family methyltransferase